MFREHGGLLPNIRECASLCRAIIIHGHTDTKRSKGQQRAFIGNGGQNLPNGIPSRIVDGGFMKRLADDPTFDLASVLVTIGQLTEFLWKTMCDLQARANDSPLAPDSIHHSAYAKYLCHLLSMDENVSFEDVTLVVSTIYPYTMDLEEHVDVMNDHVIGYSRTGTINMCFMIEEDHFKLGLQLQVIGNFRRVIRQYMVPFTAALAATVRHALEYIQKWERNMKLNFGGRSACKPKPYAREWFYLDDNLPYQRFKIYNGSKELGKDCIHGEYMLCHIGLSRVLSMSIFIHQIRRTRNILKYDQRMELAFACSLLSNPFWFDTIMDQLIAAHNDSTNQFKFGLHPFIDWLTATIDKFGYWQGGPYNRWSPCGGETSIPQAFGCHSQATMAEKERGISRLHSIMEVLFHHVLWVDSIATRNSSKNPVEDLPISMLQRHMEEVCEKIYKIVPCQFKLFRLCVFNTIMTGSGAFQAGSHLKQLMFPVQGSASYKHLQAPFIDSMSKEVAEAICDGHVESMTRSADSKDAVNVHDHDRFMQYLSSATGRHKYVRDEMECLLCESHPNRDLENCRDWFRRNQSVYDCRDDGQIIERLYGSTTEWTVVHPDDKVHPASLAFIGCTITYQNCDVELRQKANAFGEDLRDLQHNGKIIFEGRTSRTSGGEQFYGNSYSSNNSPSHPYCYKVANFYDEEHASTANLQSIKVLGNMEKPQALKTQVNSFQQFPSGLCLMNHLLIKYSNGYRTDEMRAASYHQQISCDTQSSYTVFDGHVDKNFVHTAWFIPLTIRPFFTWIAVPTSWNIPMDEKSDLEYQKWASTMSTHDRKNLVMFEEKFLRMAKVFMKEAEVKKLTYQCSVGTFLSFPANVCYHATVTVNASRLNESERFRDLLIVHPMIEG